MSHKKNKQNFFIEVFPAKFVEFEDNKVILDVRIEPKLIERRAFDKILVSNIKDIKYVALGIRQGAGYMTINCTDANEYDEEFEKLF
jgi:hypothetical protein